MTEQKKYNFVYLTTNLINGKQYVGDHSTNNINFSKSKTYFGSGKIIRDAIKLYGRKNFKKEVLEEFKTKTGAFLAQEKYISKYDTLIPNGYNISPKGGNQVFGGMSKNGRLNISNARKGKKLSVEHIKHLSNSHMGHIVLKETIEKIRKTNTGKKRSKETIQKIILSKQNMSQETKDKIKTNTKLAMKRFEVKERMSKSLKGKIPWNKGNNNNFRGKKPIA
jgi:hypothetical protein